MFTLIEIFRDSRFFAKFVAGLGVMAGIHVVGTLGYFVIGGAQANVVDSLYMTFITVATIGYAEIYDMTGRPGARLFTMLIGFAGIGSTWYLFSTFTAFILETNLNQAYRRRRMLRTIADLSNHYIVCGIGRVGSYVADELLKTGRHFVVVDSSAEAIANHEERTQHSLHVHGDSADDAVLINAGIERCAGVFAVTGDDSRNLVVSMSARALRPGARIVARVHDRRNVEKTRRAGADEIVSPDFTGGMRLASAMLRPHAVNFMDMMLRTEENLRVEEIVAPPGFAGCEIGSIAKSRDCLPVAIRDNRGNWRFNPEPAARIEAGQVIVAIVSPGGRRVIEAALGIGPAPG
jgi:voltage-gated potassium channel